MHAHDHARSIAPLDHIADEQLTIDIYAPICELCEVIGLRYLNFISSTSPTARRSGCVDSYYFLLIGQRRPVKLLDFFLI